MRVLVACEFSGIVRDAFKARSHYAMSCDLLPTEREGLHYQGDIRDIMYSKPWDLMIAHPPCTHLAVSGARYFYRKQVEQAEALDFVRLLMDAPIERICIENPVSIISSRIRKPDQIIQPWQFGHPYIKTTCLWLKNLPLLAATNIIEKPDAGWENQQFTDGRYSGYGKTWGGQREDGSYRKYGDPELKRIRNRTFQGIADAMACQWVAGG
jgi:site-specific DNA-cytosine methylase